MGGVEPGYMELVIALDTVAYSKHGYWLFAELVCRPLNNSNVLELNLNKITR